MWKKKHWHYSHEIKKKTDTNLCEEWSDKNKEDIIQEQEAQQNNTDL